MAWKNKDEVNPVAEAKETIKSDVLSMFKPAIEIPTIKRIRAGFYGKPKTGKSTICLSAPLPIYYLDTEKSAEILVKQLPEEVQKQIYILDLVDYANRKGKQLDVVQSLEVAFDVISELLDVVRNSNEVGTIVLDSVSDLWDYMKIWLGENVSDNKKFGDTIMGTEWGKANKRWKELMNLLKASNWNVLMTFKPKETYLDGKPSGKYDIDSQKNTFHDLDILYEIVNINGEHRFVCKGGRYGDTYDDLINPTFVDIKNYLSKKSGVTFE
jgi:hypothetical protein